jgi:hypothetical protein
MKYSRHVFLIAKSVCVKQLIMCSKRYVYFNLIYWFCLHDDGMYWIFITMIDILVLMNTLWHDLNWHEVYVSVWNPCRDQGVIENIFFSWLSVQFLKTVTDKSLQILALWIRIGDQDIFLNVLLGYSCYKLVYSFNLSLHIMTFFNDEHHSFTRYSPHLSSCLLAKTDVSWCMLHVHK